MDAVPRSLSRARVALSPFTALGLVAAGWLTFLFALWYASRLAAQYGPAPEVVDALQRDSYVARSILPYYAIAVLFDVFAIVVLAAPSRPGWPRAVKVVAGALLIPSFAFHGLALWIASIFAS